ncbi:MAG: hypothetical protein KJ882_07220, partial [Proteobacteria bacterium]|nr:hypothetical protein [Pseudomonadota bacterium]
TITAYPKKERSVAIDRMRYSGTPVGKQSTNSKAKASDSPFIDSINRDLTESGSDIWETYASASNIS